MDYKEAQELSLKVRWKTELCHTGEECWCRVITTETPLVYEDRGVKDEIYIAPSGSIMKDHAEHIVELHNLSLKGK